MALGRKMHMKLTPEQREKMVERLLLGEHADDLATEYGVDPSLPSLRAYTWGFTDQRLNTVPHNKITAEGRAWLASRGIVL